MKRTVIETASVLRLLREGKELYVNVWGNIVVRNYQTPHNITLTRDEIRQLRDFLTKVLKHPMPAEERAARWKALAEEFIRQGTPDDRSVIDDLYKAALESEGEV